METSPRLHPQEEWFTNSLQTPQSVRHASNAGRQDLNSRQREYNEPKHDRFTSSLYQTRAYATSIISVPDDRSYVDIVDGKHVASNGSRSQCGVSVREVGKSPSDGDADIWNAHGAEDIPLETSQQPALPTDDSPKLSPIHEYFFIFNVCLAQLLSLSSQAITVVPLMIITDTFHVADPGRMSWYTAAYSLTLGTFILPAGRLGDVYGHKRLFLIGWVWFSVWSLICGFSYRGGPIMLSVCRAFQGIGPALLIPNGIALIGRTFPIGLKRNISIAMFGGCGPVGFTVGAVFSSILAQLVWWPLAFWMLSFACCCVSILSHFVVPADVMKAVDAGMKLSEKLDVAGSITGVLGLILINFAFNQAPVVGWSAAYVPTLLAAGILLMGAFVFIELRVAIRPIVPLRGLHRDAAFTLACIAVGWASHGIWLYYSYLLIENIRGNSALTACLQTFPVAPVGFSAAVAVPFILRKVRVSCLMSAAMMFFCIGTLLLVTAPANQTYWANTFFSIMLMPLAMNWSFPSGTMLMSNAVSREHQGIAASLISTMVNYSISMGLGIAGSISRYVTPNHGILAGYRAAWYFGLTLSVLGLLISAQFVYNSRTKDRGMTRPRSVISAES